jgi:hypothetical protein
MRNALGALALAIWLFGPASVATGATLTWEFAALVHDPPASLPPSRVFFPGQILSGSLTFETEVENPLTAAVGGTHFQGIYYGAVTSLELRCATLTGPDQPGPITLVSASSGAIDGAIYLMNYPGSDSLALYGGFEPVALLEGLTGVSLSMAGVDFMPLSDGFAIPLTPPLVSELTPFDPDAYIAPRSALIFYYESGAEIRTELVSVRAVPEPGWATLLAFASLALACSRSARTS